MTDLSQASRPLLWNISAAWLMYPLFFVALGALAFGLHQRVAGWRRGRPDDERLGDWGKRLVLLVRELLLQRRVRGSRFPGLMHSLVFYSFAVFVVTTAVVAADYDLGTSLFTGWLYVALTVAAELGGVLVLIGVGMAGWRRLVSRPEALPSSAADLWPLLLLAGIVVTGFLIEGLRIASAGDPWARLTPVGAGVGLLFAGLTAETGRTLHVVLWWGHTVLAMAWIAALPYSKFFHLLALPTNVFLGRLRPRGELRRVNILELMEAASDDGDGFKVGLETVDDLTWKQRLDLDACIDCGRCEEACPAHKIGHDFSPRELFGPLQAGGGW